MTDAEWLTTDSQPVNMYRHVRMTTPRRKLLLVACGCCRLIWDHLPDPWARGAVLAQERHADGLLEDEEYQRVRTAFFDGWTREFGEPYRPGPSDEVRLAAMFAVRGALTCLGSTGMEQCFAQVVDVRRRAAPAGKQAAAQRQAKRELCGVIRDVLGNPFRPWRAFITHGGGGLFEPGGAMVYLSDTARRLAEGIHAEQAFDRMPILADALEDAGFTDAELLAHCRGGSHVRGCWALDLVLGKG